MKISQECTALVRGWEGLPDGDPSTVNLDPYMDPVDIWTIGYGRALRDAATGKYLSGMKDKAAAYAQYPGGITKAQAVTMLSTDLAGHAGTVSPLMRPNATQSQFDAFVSFDFNTGSLGSSTLRKLHVNEGPEGAKPNDAAIKALRDKVAAKALPMPGSILEGFAVWSFSKKVFFAGLFCRRLAEWRLYMGDSAANANAFGEHVRSVIAKK